MWVVLALLAGLIAIAYSPLLQSDFIRFDDRDYVITNLHVTRGLTWDGLNWAFRNAYAHNWHPLTWVSHMLDVELFGMRPGWHHLTNVLLHTANSFLVLYLLSSLTGAVGRSAFVAGLFALHPLHVESVAWVAERKDVLSTFFFLLTVIAYVKYALPKALSSRGVGDETANNVSSVSRSPAFYYASALLCFLLALLSKPMVVTLPFVLLLLDYWPLGRIADWSMTNAERGKHPWGRLVSEKVPFFCLAAAVSAITYIVQRQTHAVVDYVPLSARVANALVSYGSYLAKMVWPAHLAVFYPHPSMNYFGSRMWPAWQVAGAAVLLGAFSISAWRWRNRWPWVLTGWLWYVGTLVPVVGLIQVGSQAYADRYTYIPLIGIFVILSWGGAQFARAVIRNESVCLAAAGLLMLACTVSTWLQASHWQNTQTLFEHALSVTRSNAVAHVVLGEELMAQGKTERALEQFNRALQINPTLADTHFDLGNAYETAGKMELAIQEYQTALGYRPWYDLARKRLTAQLLKAGRKEEALAQCREVAQRNPTDPEAHINLGGMLWQFGQKAEALSEYQEAVRLDPQHAVAHYNMGLALASQGRLEEAAAEYNETIRLNHSYTEALVALGRTLTLLGRLAEAPAPFRQLAHLQPTNADFQINLGNALFMANRTNEAAEAFAAALRLRPSLPQELVQKAVTLLKQGQRDAAIARATTALRIQPDCAEARAFLDSVNEQAPARP